VVDEGGSARAVIGEESAVTVRTAICAIVDSVDVAENTATGDGDAEHASARGAK
jgi:hypothetical protein